MADRDTDTELQHEVEEFGEKLEELKTEIGKGLVGQEAVVDSVLKCLVCNGHVLLEGVPGLAKTLLVRLIATVITDASFTRVQFTPDLLPSDIVGTTVYREDTGTFSTRKGPIFANFLLADEINRTTPKVQSAMLQAMQERQVTIGKKTFDLPDPFMVLATQNPLEQAGTYPLSAAQVDRFFFKVYVDYPTPEEEEKIIDQNVEVQSLEEFGTDRILDREDLLRIQELVKDIRYSDDIKEYILNIVESTRYPDEYGLSFEDYIQYGGSARASLMMGLAARGNALFEGRAYATPDDVREVAPNILRHRILLNYEGKSRNISTDDIIEEILDNVPVV